MIRFLFLSAALALLFLVLLFLAWYLVFRSLKIVRKYVMGRLDALEELELFVESHRDEVFSREE
jgi:hypothetical protein